VPVDRSSNTKALRNNSTKHYRSVPTNQFVGLTPNDNGDELLVTTLNNK